MTRYPAVDRDAPTLVLGHGAGAGAGHPWMTRTAEGLSARGVAVVTFDFPYIAAGGKRPDPGEALETAFASVWCDVHQAVGAEGGQPIVLAGGKSMGGRIASQTAAKDLFDPAPVGLVFFGYPLHPPRQPTARRDRHLPHVTAPMLFLHGTRDPLGTPDEMRALVAGLPLATLDLVEGGDHSLVATKRADPGGTALELALDRVASWISALVRTR